MSDIVTAIIGSGMFTAIVSACVNFYFENKKSQSNEKNALKVILGIDLRRECEHYIIAGKISLDEYKQLQELNEAYHNLGGNGYMKSLMQKVEKLPVEE